VTVQTLTVANTGGADLTWSLSEAALLKGATSVPVSVSDPKSLTGSRVVLRPIAGRGHLLHAGCGGYVLLQGRVAHPGL